MAHKFTGKIKTTNPAIALACARFDVEPCGQNADWSVEAWHLGPSARPNRFDGDLYLIRGDDDGTWSVFQRFYNTDPRAIDSDDIRTIARDVTITAALTAARTLIPLPDDGIDKVHDVCGLCGTMFPIATGCTCTQAEPADDGSITVTIILQIRGDIADAQYVADAVLEAGCLQDAINDHDFDAGPLHVQSAHVDSVVQS